MARLIFLMAVLVAFNAQATKKIAQNSPPVVGKKAADKYFGRTSAGAVDVTDMDKDPSERRANESRSSGGGDEMMMLALGTFVNSAAYNWKGSDKREDVGRISYGVTYLFDSWSRIDTNLRMDFNEYKVGDDRALKLSIMPLWTFPQVDSRFPIYFGFGVGLGIFLVQLPDESNLSLDYQLVGGARFLDLFENFGFFGELALKNHLHLLSDGQFNGTAVTAGAVFTF
jgi:hypothetical protein